MIDSGLGDFLVFFAGICGFIFFVGGFLYFRLFRKKTYLKAILFSVVLAVIGLLFSPIIFSLWLKLQGTSIL